MLSQQDQSSQLFQLSDGKPSQLSDRSEQSQDQRFKSQRIRIRISKHYHQEPIISNLVSQYSLTINIKAALLGVNAKEDGWFDLELQGEINQLESALIYLNDLNLEFWQDQDSDDGW